ncbi:MAG: VCBS repeat-containing protein [Thermodesulfovibrionia bacterium]
MVLYDMFCLNVRINKIIVCSLLFIFCSTSHIYAEDTPFTPLINSIVSFFRPLSGDVTSVDEGIVKFAVGSEDGVLKGMRLRIFRKGEYFYHPVTRESLGRVEKPVGTIEVLQVKNDSASGKIVEGEAKSGDLVRMSASKKRLLFYQEETVDYYLGDAYYRGLKETGRFEIVDAPIKQIDNEKLLKLAASEKTEVVLALSSETTGEKTSLKQTLLWTTDGVIFSEDFVEIEIPPAFSKQLRFGSELLSGIEDESLLSYDLPFDAELISTGDIDGDRKPELVISRGTAIYVYNYDVDLSFLFQQKINSTETIIWMDIFDLDSDGKGEILLTAISYGSYGHNEVNSYIYRLDNQKFVPIWKTDGFIRVLDGRILYQKYSKSDGYSGHVRIIEHSRDFKKGNDYRGPASLNIYDFMAFKDKEGKKLYLSIDDNNFLNLLDTEGTTLWRSVEGMGGFIREFYEESPAEDAYIGDWYIKDRMVKKYNKIIVVKREPLLKQAKTLGYKSSQLRVYWHNGVGMEDSVLIDKITGKLLDYSVFGDKVAILSKPLLRIKAGNILKGKNPFVTLLQIYSIKGK